MALQTFSGATFDNGACFIYGLFDDVTLKMTTVRWQNLTDRPGSMTVFGPSNFKQVYPLAPNTPQTDVDVTANNITMVKTTNVSPKTGLTGDAYSLPTGWTLSFNWG